MRRFMLLPSFLLLIFGFIPSAYACQIMSQPETININDVTLNAFIVLVGKVSNISNGYEWAVIIEVEVEQYLKGQGLALVEVHLFCGTYAELENRYIFFLNPYSNEGYMLAYPLEPIAYDPTIPATAENIAAVQAITGQSTAPQPLPLSNQLIRFVTKNRVFLAESSLSLVALAGIFWFIKRKSVRKPKLKREEMP